MHKRILFVLVAVALLASVAGAQTSRVNKLTVGPTAFNTGAINLAPGTTAAKGIYFGSDVTLYRSAADTLKTDDALIVTGTLTTGALSFTNASASGTWAVTGATTLTGALTANGDVTLGNAAGDTITITGTPTFAEAVTCSKTLAVTGNGTVGGTLGVTGATTLGSTCDVTGNATVGGTATFAEDVTLTKGLSVGTTLGVTGNATLGGTCGITGNTTVGGTLGVTGNQTNTGDLTVNGNTALGNASTDTVTVNGRLIVRSVTDAGPMAATAGALAEIVFNTSDSKFYGCTVAGDPATWVAFH